jgi:hypothetical protein
LLAGIPGGRLSARAATVSASFDWRVPDRYTENGMIGVGLPVTQSDATMRILNPEGTFGGVAPTGWPADFNACASQGFIVRYLWKVNGTLANDVTTCGPTRIQFPREGLYRVELTVIDTFGGQTTTAQDVNIQDWLIIGVGDSYASGEGNPNVAATPSDIASLETLRLFAVAAQDQLLAAVADAAIAQANVDAAKRDLDAARADYNALLNASFVFAQATADLAAKQLAATNATAAVTSATAAVGAAAAKVVFECAQWWDPAGCTAAKNAYNKAVQAQSAAIAKRNTAIAQRDAAAQRVADLAWTVPAEGFDYALGVASSAINVLQARVDQLQALYTAAGNLVASKTELKDAAILALRQKAESLATWQDSRMIANNGEPYRYSPCHQSKFSGQALAALAIEQADVKTSVTFIHLACTGAQTDTGLLGEQGGVEPTPASMGRRPSQLDVAAQFSAGREVDSIVTSIGGNDIGFAKIIEECVLSEPCFATVNPAVLSDADIDTLCNNVGANMGLGLVPATLCREGLTRAKSSIGGGLGSQIEPRLTALAQSYQAVNARVQARWPGLAADRMFLTEYPLVTRDQNGNICGFETDPVNNMPGISSAEYLWAEQVVGRRLNEVIANQGPALGWTPVTGIANAFATHGYCSTQTWLVRIDDSLETQAAPMGIAHPTVAGHQAYSVAIAAALQQKFYPGGVARVDGRQ